MAFKVIDLFAGCGGLSKGFEQAGFEVIGFVENWIPAIETHMINQPKSKLISKDIKEISDQEILTIAKEYGKIDGIIGGPPCQGFSTIGKRDPKDPRNSLFMDFIRFIKILKPDFFLMENVRGLTSTKNHLGEPIINIILEEFDKLGYKINYKLIRAADYGVPQIRDRLIILGHKEKKIEFPLPSHSNKSDGLNDYITIDETISNLPELDNENRGHEEVEIVLNPITDIQKILSNSNNKLLNHQISPQNNLDIERGKYVPEGRYIRITKSGLRNDIFPKEELYLKESTIKQQKFCRLDRNKPSWTVLTDWHTMRQKIHPSQNRSFSVREVARFQTFPDDFRFMGNINDKYKQIGNAVPVLLAKLLAERIYEELSKIK